LRHNNNRVEAQPKAEGIISAQVAGRPGQVIALYPARGATQFCEVASNPVLRNLVCEFSQLPPGIYTVEALNTESRLALFVDGQGRAEVAFSPNATTTTPLQTAPLVGYGARPRHAPSGPPDHIPATATFTPTLTPTVSPAFAWQGRVVSVTDFVIGTIGVRAAGLKDHPVVLRSGTWQSQPLLTGSKPELGNYAAEFGGLTPGNYIIELADLATYPITLAPNQYILVEFRYDFVQEPTGD
jgi:hypothetical protein